MARKTPSTLLFLVAALLAWPARAQGPAERMTVDDAVRIALEHQPTLAASRAQVHVAAARTRQAWSSMLPSLAASFSYNPQTANFAASPAFQRILAAGGVSVGIDRDCKGDPTCAAAAQPCVLTAGTAGKCFAASTRPGTSGELFNFYVGQVGINWTAFDFGRSYFGAQAANANETAAERASEASALQVALDARSAFYTALTADALVTVAEDSEATQRRHLEQMQGFFEVGTRTRVDVAQARSDLAQADVTLARARGQQQAARAALHAALGLEDWHELALVPPVDDPLVQPDLIPPDATEEAVRSRPEPRQFAALARGWAEQEKSYRGTWLPQLTLSLGPSFAGTALTDLTPNFQVALTLGYPLLGLNPVLVSGQVREARAAYRVSTEQARAVRNQIRLETAQAEADVRSAREQVVAAVALLTAAKERRDLANGRFEAGLGTVLELQDAEFAYVNARATEVQAGYQLRIARARLDKALGR